MIAILIFLFVVSVVLTTILYLVLADENSGGESMIKISAKEAKAFLKDCDRRTINDGFQVFYNGKWMELGRTDELDDIRTMICDAKFKDYKPRFGARITTDGFFVIDSISDG